MATQTNNLLLLESGLARTVNSTDNIVLDAFIEEPDIGVTAIAGDAIITGDLVTLYNDGGTLKAFKSNASWGSGDRKFVTGVSLQTKSIGETVRLVTMAGSAVPVTFTSAPATANNGDAVYLSLVAGKATLTAPNQKGETVFRIGILEGGDGASTTVDVKFLPSFVAQIADPDSITDTAAFSSHIVYRTTTDATPTELTLDGAAPSGTTNTLALSANSTVHYKINIVARKTNADGENAGYTIHAAARKDANNATTALVDGTILVIVAEETDATWTAAVAANTTDGTLRVLVTGAVGDTIAWTAHVAAVKSTE